MSGFVRFLVSGCLAVGLLAQCNDIPGLCDDPGSCQSGEGVGGEAGGGEAGAVRDGGTGPQPPADCDPQAEPRKAPKCVVDGYGVFVDASKTGAGNGTKASPFSTIGAALAGRGDKRRIYICQGDYNEGIVLTDSVSLYGGFACSDWSSTDARPRVIPPKGTSYALDMHADDVTIADLELLGLELGEPNSIAVRVRDSHNITFLRSRLEGRTGADGASPTLDEVPFPTDLAGVAGAAGGAAKPVTCLAGPSTGGKGGASNGQSGDNGLPAIVGGGAGGDLAKSCSLGGAGEDGQPGANMAPAEGARTPGRLVDNAWISAAGTPGASGGTGQGGGGGHGRSDGTGGGGGAGGCGGAGGPAGGGGGASVAVLVINSVVSTKAGELVSGQAGSGGNGSLGQAGQIAGGPGGAEDRVGTHDGCGGGKGGKGGTGGAGGGGAGGVSALVLYVGARPNIELDTKATLGTAGALGRGGATPANDGLFTDAAETLVASP